MTEFDELEDPLPTTVPHTHLFPMTTCAVCYHPQHDGQCKHNDDIWQDPLVGGSADNPPRICGCEEYVQMYEHPDSTGK